MFERFTDRARRVVTLSQEEARMLSHNYIGTEHILLGLCAEGEGVAAKTLESLGISLGGIRSQIEEIIGHGQESPSGHIPFTPRAKKVLELSLREALQLGHNYIGTEHILLGLIREGEGVGSQVLVRLGAELTIVRQRVIQLLSGYVPKETGSTDELDAQIAKVRKDKERAIDNQDFTGATELRDQEKLLCRARTAIQKLHADLMGEVDPKYAPEARLKVQGDTNTLEIPFGKFSEVIKMVLTGHELVALENTLWSVGDIPPAPHAICQCGYSSMLNRRASHLMDALIKELGVQ